jgi:hypothetical protein
MSIECARSLAGEGGLHHQQCDQGREQKQKSEYRKPHEAASSKGAVAEKFGMFLPKIGGYALTTGG